MTGYREYADTDGSRNKYLIFLLGGRRYGISILNMAEIVRMQPITPMPELPEDVRGIIHLRGQVIPVIDLPGRLGFPPLDEGADRACIVILRFQERPVGVIVEEIEEVRDIPPEDVVPAPPVQGDRSPVTGVGKLPHDLILLLDVPRMLGDDLDWLSHQQED